VTRLRNGRPGFDSRQEQEYFSLRHRVQTGSGGPLSVLSNWYWSPLARGKTAGAWSWPITSI